jgi:endonuclease/exonuclease/phosphatase (EEP) superfamily protein YafD
MKQHWKNFLQVRKARIPDSRLTQCLHCEADVLPNKFTVVVWNIFKRHGADIFDKDICDLSERADIVCLQEVLSTQHLDLPAAVRGLNHNYAISYCRPDGFTEGVLTASHYNLAEDCGALLSIAREPVTNTPKTALVSVIALANGQQLLVINLHMLLFKRRSIFKKELQQILDYCAEYDDLPAIFCGDFNTFTQTQQKFLDGMLATRGYSRCIPLHEPRAKRFLDHIYIRGLNVLMMEIIDTISSSDHYPLICTLELKNE